MSNFFLDAHGNVNVNANKFKQTRFVFTDTAIKPQITTLQLQINSKLQIPIVRPINSRQETKHFNLLLDISLLFYLF